MSEWRRVEPLVMGGGDCGGDAQISEAFNARWVQEHSGGEHAVVTRQFYIAEHEGGEPFLECQTEYVLCSDPSDPGSTELLSRECYVDCGPCDRDADAVVAAHRAVAPTNEEWAAAFNS
ncbi:MAG TPA: hypothetical protein VK453_25500 [Micromonosporaceae bacterium]|nr:hypothetical protein [Micromonosporaceae bacterium]